MNEPRDEREFKFKIEIGTPPGLPGGKVTAQFERKWEKRAENFVNETVEAANLTEEELLRRIREEDGFADIFQRVSRRIIADGDPVMHDTLTRLVVAALHDDARIDEISYILNKIDYFHPVHIRIVAKLPNPPLFNYQNLPDSRRLARKEIAERKQASLENRTLSQSEIARKVNASTGIVVSALGDLEKDSFVESNDNPQFFLNDRKYALGELGRTFRNLVDEIAMRTAWRR